MKFHRTKESLICVRDYYFIISTLARLRNALRFEETLAVIVSEGI